MNESWGFFIIFLYNFCQTLWFQNLCRNCKRHYCNDCFAKETNFVPGENSRNCLTCRALQSPLAYKDHLIRLKVKDLQDYLRARQIATNHCKEKRDLVELILRHVEGRSNAASSSTAHSQQGRQQPQAQPSYPLPPNFFSARIGQPRGSNFQPPSNVQPVQVCVVIEQCLILIFFRVVSLERKHPWILFIGVWYKYVC